MDRGLPTLSCIDLYVARRRFTLTKPNDIHSTEKLLELIRSPKPDVPPDVSPNETEKPSSNLKSALKPSLPLKKRYIVGVDIGHTYIKMAKTVCLKDKSYELLDYLNIPFNAQISFNDPSFSERLKEGLDRICSERTDCDIWSTIPSAKVETRRLRIPKLARKQIANAVFWTFTNKVEFNEKDEILDYEVLGDITEGGIKKTDVMAFKTPKAEVVQLKQVFSQIGYPLKGISIVPFAIQNLFRSRIISQPEQDVCALFIGRDWSRIAIYSDGDLVLSRGIKAGMRSMVEAIHLAMHDHQEPFDNGAHRDLEATAQGSEPSDTIAPEAQKLFFDFLHQKLAPPQSSNGNGTPGVRDVFQMILPAMERLIRQVERTFEHYMLNFQGDGVKRIYLSGQVTANPMIVDHIGHQLDMAIEVMNPFPKGSAFIRQVNVPETQAERESYLPAVGLALSNNRTTPNVLFTHKDKDRLESIRAFNQRVLIGTMIGLLFMIGLFSWQERQLDDRREQINKLNYKLLSFNPVAEKQILLTLFSQNKQKRQGFERIVHRYAPVAVINELSQITPANIRLLEIDGMFPVGSAGKTPAQKTIIVSGIVFADPASAEALLTGYLLTLKNSPLFNKPALQNKGKAYYNNQEVLRFTARLEVL